MVHLVIAGHGKQRNGTFDPGATGYIKKGEHKYVVEDLFPAIKRHLPKGHDVVLFSKYKVSNYGNIAALAKEYKASQITEIHFDAAAAESARGGHVIVHKSFAPDKTDLALRDAIKKMVGVRYSHKGHEGISGRDNLYNVNATAKAGITYRLIELGFGSNKRDADILTKQVDQYAKELVKAITGKVIDKPTEQASNPAKPSNSKPSKPNKKSVAQMAKEVLAGKHGNGHTARQKSLGISNAEYAKVRSEVNRIATGGKVTKPKPSKTKPSKTIKQMADEVVKGLHGNGHAQRQKSLGVDSATYNKVRAEVNKRF